MSSLTEVQMLVGAWGEKTFPKSNRRTIIAHLKEEIVELEEADQQLELNRAKSEAADCFLLLLHYAHKNEFDLLNAAIAKMKINMKREWNTEPEPEGHFKHKGD